jgi:hypothetical protein
MFDLVFAEEAASQLKALEKHPASAKRHKAVCKALAFLESNPRHPGLRTHKYIGHKGPHGAELFEAYAENRTPGAYRIFWCYGPGKNTLAILTIVPHP